MPLKQTQSHAQTKPPAAVVLFGLDEHGKPKAARFGKGETALATKAAKQLHLRVLQVIAPDVAALAAKLPAGRIHASGSGVVSSIRTDLYAELLAAAGVDTPSPEQPPQPPGNAGSDGKPPSGKKNDDYRFPKDWDELAPGHLVIAQESSEDGWYAAIIVERSGDMCTLRWRDYPRDRRFTRHYRNLALLCIDKDVLPKAATYQAPKNGGKSSGKSKPTADGLPHNWMDIDVGHLVLAKDDGPWESYWEAIPTDNNGITLTLKWRDYAALPKIERGRTTLALLCPKAM